MVVLRSNAARAVAILAVCLTGTPGGQAAAAPVTVNVRVEGRNATIFEGPVTTDAKTLTKDASGAHPCDGTNGGANPNPGPTMTGALDDAALANNFTWDGTWFSFGDFGIDRVGPDAATSTEFWGYALNYQSSMVGGCQQQVANGDDVLFGFDYFSKAHLLKLTAPESAEPGQPVTVTVLDGQDNSPIAGATVGGALTGADGKAQVTFPDVGRQSLKADRADSVRSNAALVCVHRGDDGTCGTTPQAAGGTLPPKVTRSPVSALVGLSAGQRFAAGKGPRLLKGHVDLGSGRLQAVRLRLRRVTSGKCYFWSVKAEKWRHRACSTDGFFYTIGDDADWSYLFPARLGPGRYDLHAKAVDAGGLSQDAYVLFRVAAKG
jgi:hypothetical protein